MDRVQRITTEMIRGLIRGNLHSEGRLKELGLFSLEKGRLRRDLITMFQYWRGSYKEDRDFLGRDLHEEDKGQWVEDTVEEA